MKAEDIREGMWVRSLTYGIPAKVGPAVETCMGWALTFLTGTTRSGVLTAPQHWEPWTPRVGERIRAPSIGPGHGVVCVVADGGVITEGGYMVPFDKIEPCSPPEAKPAREMTCEEHLDAIAAEPRGHNATCPRCGGKAYQGLLNAQCIEPVCDDPETREPSKVIQVVDERMRGGFAFDDGHDEVREVVFEAIGRDVTVRHPTREGAIQAWREAVRRG